MNVYSSEGKVYKTAKVVDEAFGLKAKGKNTVKEQRNKIIEEKIPDINGVVYFYDKVEWQKYMMGNGIKSDVLPTTLTVANNKIKEYEKICKFYQKFIDNVSNVSQKIIDEQLRWQDLWLEEAKKIYVFPTENEKAEQPTVEMPVTEPKQEIIELPQVESVEKSKKTLNEAEQYFYDVISKEGDKFLNDDFMKKIGGENYELYAQLTKEQKLKLMFNVKSKQLFSDYENNEDWDETKDINEFDEEQWKIDHAKKLAEFQKKQEAKKIAEEQKKKEEPQELPIPELSVEAYRLEIEICRDTKRLKQIAEICDGVLAKCTHNRKIREKNYQGTEDLRVVEYDAREIQQMAMKQLDNLQNPQIEEPQQIEFHWSASDKFVNEMWLKEISSYDEMMCRMAKEAHEKDLQRYNEALEQGTNRETEFKAKKAFEEQYLAELAKHEKSLVEKRIEFNTDYECRKFGFDEFETQKNKLEQILKNVQMMKIDATNVDKVKISIRAHEKQMEKDLMEYKDSITPDGIVYNKYALAMRYRIVNIAKGKLKAYNSGEDYVEEKPQGKELKAVYSLEDTLFKLTHGGTTATSDLQYMKDRFLKKIQEKDYQVSYQFIALMCVGYRVVMAHLDSQF